MNRFIIALVVAALIVVGGYYFVNNSHPPAPEDGPSTPAYLEMAESALATQGAVLIAHADIEKARATGQAFLEKIDSLSFPEDMAKENRFLTAMREQGIDLKKQLDQALSAFLVTEKGNRYVLMLRGNFKPADIRKAVEQAFVVVDPGEDGADMVFIYKNYRSCALSPPLRMHVTRKQIIVTTPDMMPILMERMTSNTPAEIDLTAWRNFRQTHFFSLGLMHPRETLASIPHPELQSIVGQSVTRDVETVFFGMSGDQNSAGTSAILEAEVHADNAEWPQKTANNIQLGRAAFRSLMAHKMPAAAQLEASFQVVPQGNTLKMSFPLTAQGMDETQDALRDIGNTVMSKTTGLGSAVDKLLKPRESVLTSGELPHFAQDYGHNKLPAFSGNLPFIKADTAAGPFAIALDKAVLATKHTRTYTELTFKARSEPLQNLPVDDMNIDDPDSAVATFQITGIYDDEGQNLLADEDCGADRNDKEKPLSIQGALEIINGKSILQSHLEGTKTVRLAAEYGLQDIARIDGKIVLTVPTSVKSVRYPQPLEDHALDTGQTRIFFRDSDPHKLKYAVEGKKNLILAVYGLNKQGQVLRNRSSLGTSSAFRKQRNVSRDIQGTIDAAEIVYADSTETQAYPFTITSFFTHFDSGSKHNAAVLAQPDDPKKFPELAKLYNFSGFCDKKSKTVTLPPLHLCLNDLKYHGKLWGMGTQYSLAIPASSALTGNLTGVEFVIGGYTTPRGYIELLDHQFLATDIQSAGKGGPPFLKASSISFRTRDPDALLDKQRITGIVGKIVLHMPLEMQREHIPNLNLGTRVEAPNNSIALTLREITQSSISFSVDGDVSRLVHLIPVTRGKKLLPLKSAAFSYDGARPILTLTPTGGTPASFEMIYATQKEMLQYPFHIKF